MRILVTNDDGIHAPGLKTLEKIAKELTRDVWVVAPESEQSGSSHSLTIHLPLRVRRLSARRFAVSGTPTDCVAMGVHQVIPGRKPDLVLSGVNRGTNMGDDVTYSGTIAAAMEGCLLKIPSVALSQMVKPGQSVKWATAAHHAPPVLRALLKEGWPEGVLMNVNFPDVLHTKVTGVEVCPQGERDYSDMVIDERTDARGNLYYWLGFRRVTGEPQARTDLAQVWGGGIAVTPLQLNLTHRGTMRSLKKAFENKNFGDIASE
ncbi:5'/3'-nucleotidase SurE [Marinibaculum pumilum]|uniref:5'-nucleotidase SurE n=1 Tax=Marinibaculum pumilum TaxID=1766165 RepID=A0ABV7KWG8_9PROT